MTTAPTNGFDWGADLKSRAHAFDLFQAIFLLERLYPDRQRVGTSTGMDEAARLSAHVSLSFQPSDISSLGNSKREGPPLTLTTGVLSLAGAQSPLPLWFSEWLLERKHNKDLAPVDFLDIFNQRLLGLLFRNRAKHSLALWSAPLVDAPLLRALSRIAALQATSTKPHTSVSWLRHAGLEGAAPRSLESLLTVIKDRTGMVVKGRQFKGAWLPVSRANRAALQCSRYGQSRLGLNASLGARAWDQAAGIELEAWPEDESGFIALLPGGSLHDRLGEMTQHHLQAYLGLQLRLHWPVVQRQGTAMPRFALDATVASAGTQCHALRLGYTSWLLGPSSSLTGAHRERPKLEPVIVQHQLMPTEGLDHGH